MKKSFIKLLVLTIVATNVAVASNTITFAAELSNQTTQVSVNYDKIYNDIIKSKGSVLSYQDFYEINENINSLKKQNIQITDTMVKKQIVEKIEHKALLRGYTVFGTNITSAELALVASYPRQAVLAYADAPTAESTADSLYENDTMYLGNGDAFRHTYWNALMAKDIGQNLAAAFATAHESETSDGVDKTMDLNNNDVGRRLGGFTSRSNLKSEIMRYCDNGWLNRVVDGELTVTDSSGKR